jgi:NADPH:quinone reductase-like Zn-dependent oxidoreductase
MKLRYKILSGLFGLLAIAVAALGIVIGYTAPCEPAPESASGGAQMKAIVYRCYGSPEVLAFEDVARPGPGENEVLVKVEAASVNPLDWHYMRGSPYLMRLGTGIGSPKDSRMGRDFAGVVTAVGEQVTEFKPGDEVFGGASGAFAEYVLVSEDRAIAHIPVGVSFEQAASLPVAALTAIQALRDKGDLQPGQKVLINGASGGVGTFAVQIAKSMGAEVHGVCSTRNVELVRSLGADRVFDYKKEDVTESGEVYDLVIDMVGNHSLSKIRGVMSPDGKLVMVGGPSGNWVAPLKRPITALVSGPFFDQELIMLLARLRADDLAEVADLVQSGAVTPVIDRRFTLDDVPAAIAYSEEGRARGKILIEF